MKDEIKNLLSHLDFIDAQVKHYAKLVVNLTTEREKVMSALTDQVAATVAAANTAISALQADEQAAITALQTAQTAFAAISTADAPLAPAAS